MAFNTSVLLFGDQANDYSDQLKRLLHVSSHPVLESFFQRATYLLRVQIGQLTASQQKLFPRFVSISDLLTAKEREGSNPAIEAYLLCLTQLASFIRHFSSAYHQYPQREFTYALGLCMGALAAAAVGASRSIAELVPAALQSILVAFKTGLHALETGRSLEQCSSSSNVWSVTLSLGRDDATGRFASALSSKTFTGGSKPYISAIADNYVTVSGGPTSLKKLLATAEFDGVSSARLPICAPFHAPHLYSEHDIDLILEPCDSQLLSSQQSSLKVVSSSSGHEISDTTFGGLLRQALRSILIETLRWDQVLQQMASRLKDVSRIELIPLLASPKGLSSAIAKVSKAIITSTRVSDDAQSESHCSGNPAKSKIAIIGYAGRFPEAASAEDLWQEVLRKGRDVHREIPKDRFNVDAHFDASGQKKNTSKVRYGCFINEPGLFDTKFFNMSPREASNSDPGQRLALTTAYEALEMAGFVSNSSPFTQKNRVGIFYGMTSDDWREVNSGQNVDTYFIPGGNRAFTPGRINYHFKFSGPSFSIDTACSSSFAAIHTACNSLWRGDCDTAIAGGTNVMTNPDNFAGLDRGHFLSTTGNCNTFDDGANGYCRADAVGSVVLKRLEDAQADGDPIKAVIVGAYTNHSAEADSITRPHVGAQAFIFNKLLSEAAVNPLDVSYIEMHGTGTQAGDAVEMSSVLEVFGKEKRGPEHPLYLGSVKANVGHAESASGVTSLIKVLKMMEKSEIPPNCGIKTKINRNFPTDLKDRNVNIPLEVTSWPRPASGKRIAFLNNFSAAGGNTALLVEDAPTVNSTAALKTRDCHIVAVSARSKLSLQRNIASLIDYITTDSKVSLEMLAFTTTARRLHHNHRMTFQASDLSSLETQLRDSLDTCQQVGPLPIATRVPKVIFVFSGQGSIYVELGLQLYRSHSPFRIAIDRLDHAVQTLGFPSFVGLINGAIRDLSEAEIIVTQLAMTATQICLTDFWLSLGIAPAAVIGHSIGEFAAMYAAGVLSATDAMFLVGARARLIQDRCSEGTHCMLAAKCRVPDLETMMNDSMCDIACMNGPEDTVISGAIEHIDAMMTKLGAKKIKCTKLNVPFAFHSSQMEPIVQDIDKVALPIQFKSPNVPYLSPLLGEAIAPGSTVINHTYLSQACRGSVDFHSALNSALESELVKSNDIWLEIGPHSVCGNMVRASLQTQSDRVLTTLQRQTNDWQALAKAVSSIHLAGHDICWNEFHHDSRDKHIEVLQLPAYQWDNKCYWIQYENDFCLTKGDGTSSGKSNGQEEDVPQELCTSAVQKTLSQKFEDDKAEIVIESDVHQSGLLATIRGHLVNGAALCPSSLWADVALTLSNYLIEKSGRDDDHVSMNVSEMNVVRPLIARESGPQLYQASACAVWSSHRISISIYSVDAKGNKTADHATCTVELGNRRDWLSLWKRNAYLIQSRIQSLEQGVLVGSSHNIKRGLAYKLFGALVDYSKSYQGMEQVILNSHDFEATARVKFQTTTEEENHHISPFWIDSLGHIAGFIMNANDGVDSKNQVFINHGWESMRCTSRFSRSKVYTTYNRMQNIEGSMYAGDTYIFDGEDIVAVFGGVKFQGVPRQTLNNLLPNRATSSSTRLPAKADMKATKSNTVSDKKQRKSSTRSSREISPLSSDRQKSEADSLTTKFIAVIADEIGLDVSELTSNVAFADIGVDSLLSLTIASRLREELDMKVTSELFTEFSTIGEVIDHLHPRRLTTPSNSFSTLASTHQSSTAQSLSPSEDDTDLTDLSEDEATTGSKSPGGKNIMGTILKIVSEEIGLDDGEAEENDVKLGDLGVDSLLSLTMLDRLRDEFPDLDVPSDIFADNNTFADIGQALGHEEKQKPSRKGSSQQSALPDISKSQLDIPRSSSLVLQGNSKRASKTLFLFPDGSGSATSYAHMPNIASDVAVIGLNCPFMKTPENMKFSLDEITPSYIEEIQRRQPHGPYYLGGWSAGGICAMDAAQEFIRCGEKVERLVLIDSPNPIGLEKLPPRLYDFFKTIGLFGEGGRPPPSWLLPHFLAFIDSLDMYKPKAFKPGKAPGTHIIWAKDGVCKYPDSPRPTAGPDDPREMWWLLENRKELGANGWDKLIDGDKLSITVMENVNHFSMMQGDQVTKLVEIIKQALA